MGSAGRRRFGEARFSEVRRRHDPASPRAGRDVVVIANLAEQSKRDYVIGLPFAGDWLELLNSDVYDSFPNAAPVGNGGRVHSWSEPLDGFSARAAVSLPANGIIVLAPSTAH